MEKLKVTNIRYFETRRGLGYECKTNIKGLSIWNDGDGGTTYLEKTYESGSISSLENKHIRNEYVLLSGMYSADIFERMIDDYEGVTQEDREKVIEDFTEKLLFNERFK